MEEFQNQMRNMNYQTAPLENSRIDETVQLDAETAKAKLEQEQNPNSFHDELQQKINEIHLSISKQDIIQLQQEGLQISHRSNDRRNIKQLRQVKFNNGNMTSSNQNLETGNEDTSQIANQTANQTAKSKNDTTTGGIKIFKVKKSPTKNKKKKDKDPDGDSSTPIESDNEAGEKEPTERRKDETIKTEKLSSHLNTVREKYKKQRASLIKDMEQDELGKFMMSDKVTFASILIDKIRQDPTIISVDALWPEIMRALNQMADVNNENGGDNLALAFYDNEGDLWQIQKCGKLVQKDDDKL